MSRKPDSDRRQQDFFGPAEADPKAPRPPRDRLPKARVVDEPEQAKPPTHVPPLPEPEDPGDDGLHDRIARLSPAELRALTATLTDDALGQLTLATIRQLKRRLTRAQRHGGKGQRSSLERAAQELVAEFRGQGDEDDF